MKKLLAVIMSLCLVFAFTACGGSDTSSEEGAYEMVIGHVYTTDSLEEQQIEKFKELVEAETDGALAVTVYPNEQLGAEKDICEQVVMGTCDVSFSEGSMWATVTDKTEFGVLGLPFMYTSIDAMNEVIKTKVRTDLAEIVADTDVVPIGTVGSGMRQVWTVDKQIKTAEDFAGLKIRVPAVTLYVDMFENLGCNPTTTAFSECYQALQQGVVEGCECDIPNVVQQNWHEVCNYMSYTNHLAALNIICINKAKWESYPAEIQEAITKCMEEAEEYSFEIRATSDEEYLKSVNEQNVEIYEIPGEEIAKMKEMEEPIYKQFEELGLGDLLDSIAEINKKYE